MGRKPVLPDNAQLLKYEAAGMTHEEIARKYGVTRQAVTKRFNAMGEYVGRGPLKEVTNELPWDIANHPAKEKLYHQEPFMGLRAFLRKKMGIEVSARSQVALTHFLAHIENGEVLDLHARDGAVYVERDPERDASLVVRWPSGVPQDARTALFRWERDGQTVMK